MQRVARGLDSDAQRILRRGTRGLCSCRDAAPASCGSGWDAGAADGAGLLGQAQQRSLHKVAKNNKKLNRNFNFKRSV